MTMKTAKRIALALLLALSSGIAYSQEVQPDGAAAAAETNAAAPVARESGIMGASYVEDLRAWVASKVGMDANGFFFSLVFLIFCIGFLYLLLMGLNLLHLPIRRQVGFWGVVRLLAFVSGSASLWISFLCPDREWLPTILMCGLILFTVILAWLLATKASHKASTECAAVGLVLADCAFIGIVLLFSKVLIHEIIMAIIITIGLFVLDLVFSRRRR